MNLVRDALCSWHREVHCSKIRKKRIREKYLHYINNLEINRKNSLYFVTISPENYNKKFTFKKKIKKKVIVLTELEAGIEHIKKSFSKFRRLKYIKKIVLGGICTIESKKVYKCHAYFSKKGELLGYHAKTGWNVHLHIILYGGRLDNQIRGKCLDCGQNLMKYDKNLKSYYYSSKKCESYNVEIKDKDSKIVSFFKKCSQREVNIDIKHLSSNEHVLNYMLKYVSSSKEDFLYPKDLAQYLIATWQKKAVILFGKFVKDAPKRIKEESDIEYVNDPQVVNLIREELEKPKPPKNILDYDRGD